MKKSVSLELQNYYQKLKVYKALDWKKKEAVDLLMIEQLRLKPSERISFEQIISRVNNENRVIKISDELIMEMQTNRLNNEIGIFHITSKLKEIVNIKYQPSQSQTLRNLKSDLKQIIYN